MSKRKLERQSASRNVKVQAETLSLSPTSWKQNLPTATQKQTE